MRLRAPDGPRAARPIEVLLVEDNPGDARLTRVAFDEGDECVELRIVEDGVKALAYLRKEGSYDAALTPDLVILDLNLPRKNGREVLEEVKADSELRRIPVVILTTSSAHDDVVTAYDLHANAYIVKPVDLDRFIEVVRTFESFWLSAARLPTLA